jgi:hypothetical protein
MLWPLLFLALQTADANAISQPLAALTILNGEWSVTGAHTMAGAGKSDSLVNHCSMYDAFYACEQVVNGKALALIVFTSTSTPGSFHTQVNLPDGHATGRADLNIVGSHWTYNGKSTSDDGKTSTFYRTENMFTGRDRIHFDQYESSDGSTWQKKNEGDEVRAGAH